MFLGMFRGGEEIFFSPKVIPGTELKLALLTPGYNAMAGNVVMWACGTVTICGTAILLFLDTCGTAILFFLHVWYRHPVFLQIIKKTGWRYHVSKKVGWRYHIW